MLSKADKSPVFAELRAVDNNYQLYGKIETLPEGVSNKIFADLQKPTVLINESIQNLLNVSPGDDIVIMGKNFEVAGLVTSVPDLAERAVFGEFAMISKASYQKFGLSSGGSFLDHEYRIKFNQSSDNLDQEEQVKSIILSLIHI